MPLESVVINVLCDSYQELYSPQPWETALHTEQECLEKSREQAFISLNTSMKVHSQLDEILLYIDQEKNIPRLASLSLNIKHALLISLSHCHMVRSA